MEKGKAKAREPEEEASPKGAKRARVNDAGDAVQNTQEEVNEEGEDEENAAPPQKRVKTLPRDVDGYARFFFPISDTFLEYFAADSSPAPSCASSCATLSPTTRSNSARVPI
jgi:hypothetical protein